MNLNLLNPQLRDASVYEKITRQDECIGYDNALFYVISGDVSATVGGAKISHLGPGHLLYIPRGTVYRLKSKYVKLAVFRFDLTYREGISYDRISPVEPALFDPSSLDDMIFPPFDKVIHLENMEAERDGIIRMCNVFTSKEGSYLSELSARLKLLLLLIAETSDDNALPRAMVEALDDYIRNNIDDEISNTEIGAIFGYHPFYVSRLLKDKKGQTLHQYIISQRLKLAKQLLSLTDHPISEVGEACGFSDPSYFTKTFRQIFGMTPKEYRNSFKEDFI